MSSASAKNPSMTFNTAGTYTVSLIADNVYGSGTVASKIISVNAIPAVLATLSSSAICNNQTATLTAGGASSYAWSTSSSATLIAVSPSSTTAYTLTGTDLNGCQATDIKTLVVNALPAVSVISNPASATLCAADAVSLSGSGALSYSWSGGITNAASFTVNAGTPSYTLTGTDVNGCQNSAGITLTVHALPSIVVAVSPTTAAVCSGESIVFNASGATSYTWTGSAVNGTSFIPATSGVYTVAATDVNGCKNSATQSVTVNSLPVLSVTGSTAVCTGSGASFTPAGGVSYSMVTVLGTVVSSGSFVTTPTANETYTFIAINSNSCTSVLTWPILVNPLPIISLAGNMVLCAGDIATITPSGASTYSWSNGSTAASLVIAPLPGNNYTVTGFDINGCKDIASTNFTINDLPVLTASSSNPLICAGQSATLSVSGASAYLWSTSATASSIVVSPANTSTYSVTGTATNNCSAVTLLVQQVSNCTGIGHPTKTAGISIYPNPNTGTFNIELNTQGNLHVEIYNAIGERVYSAKLENGGNAVSLPGQHGIYFYRIVEGDRNVEAGKILVE